jgi:hypothetical protein
VRKRARITSRRSDPSKQATQVTTQIELPPYRGPRSPLDLTPLEIVFVRKFEAFRWVLQAKTDVAAAPIRGDNHLPKRTHRVSTAKKIAVAKYVFYFI